jgi:hypothetical protein
VHDGGVRELGQATPLPPGPQAPLTAAAGWRSCQKDPLDATPEPRIQQVP